MAYVYRLTHQGKTLYIGKGSGNRLANQRRAFRLDGEIIWECKSEREAYKRERELVAMFSPLLNRCAGGCGSYQLRPRSRPSVLDRDIARLGTRVAAAQILLRAKHLIEPATYAAIRAVAYSKPLAASLR